MARWGAVRTIGWGTMGMAGAFLPLILLRHWVGAGFGFIAMMTLLSLTVPVFTLFSQECVVARWRNLVSGTMFMAMGGSVAAMAFGGGYLIVTMGYRTLFLVAAGLTLVGALLFFVYFPRTRKVLAYTVVSGGYYKEASGYAAAVSGGYRNKAKETYAASAPWSADRR